MEKTIKVLFCRRNHHPEEREVKNNLINFSKEIGAYSDKVSEVGIWHLTQEVVMIYNTTGQNKNLNLINRILTLDTGMVDVIRGNFFICGEDGDEFRSLTDYEIEKIDPCIQLSEIELYDLRSALRGDTNS